MPRFNRLQKFSIPLVWTRPLTYPLHVVNHVVHIFVAETVVGHSFIGVDGRTKFHFFANLGCKVSTLVSTTTLARTSLRPRSSRPMTMVLP